ncbi:hypothetical protein GJ698_20045 [Pseudoduganella sp. FT26W]|uniref:Uncharacterized protein n=1 Tax=Duganella aquatilis TaxID=2666082 RepID=A0A844DEN1_9BURK|nr:hypothetical protein [Duganella aquatilis]MRW86369.1 hypothetical protein [Duganella aquatilis]
MSYKLDLPEETDELLQSLSVSTGLSFSYMVNKLLSAHLTDLHELLALVEAHPELEEEAANVFHSFGPEQMMVGIKRIAPPAYLTLAERFERDVGVSRDPAQFTSH